MRAWMRYVVEAAAEFGRGIDTASAIRPPSKVFVGASSNSSIRRRPHVPTTDLRMYSDMIDWGLGSVKDWRGK